MCVPQECGNRLRASTKQPGGGCAGRRYLQRGKSRVPTSLAERRHMPAACVTNKFGVACQRDVTCDARVGLPFAAVLAQLAGLNAATLYVIARPPLSPSLPAAPGLATAYPVPAAGTGQAGGQGEEKKTSVDDGICRRSAARLRRYFSAVKTPVRKTPRVSIALIYIRIAQHGYVLLLLPLPAPAPQWMFVNMRFECFH